MVKLFIGIIQAPAPLAASVEEIAKQLGTDIGRNSKAITVLQKDQCELKNKVEGLKSQIDCLDEKIEKRIE